MKMLEVSHVNKRKSQQLKFQLFILVFMKRVPTHDVNLLIEVDKNEDNIVIRQSIHTTIHSLKVKVSKILNFCHLDCQIDFYSYTSKNILKPTTTLLQNGITSNISLKCYINRIQKINNQEDKVQYFGLSFLAECTSKICLNFKKDYVVGVGYGKFSIYDLISQMRCDICPYKSQHFRPLMRCKKIRVNKCAYRVKTIIKDINGIPQEKVSNYEEVVEEKDLSELGKINGHIVIQVKHI